jgi:integrase/recombinase XerD
MGEVNSFLINPKKRGGAQWNCWKPQIFFDHQSMNAKKNTLRNYQTVLAKFENYFGNIELTSITRDNILPFPMNISKGAKQFTRKLRYSLLSAFFNFIKSSFDPGLQNP